MMDIKFKGRGVGKTAELIDIALNESFNKSVLFLTKYNHRKFNRQYQSANLRFIGNLFEYDMYYNKADVIIFDEEFPSLSNLLEIHTKGKDFYFRGTLAKPMDSGVKDFLTIYYPECLI